MIKKNSIKVEKNEKMKLRWNCKIIFMILYILLSWESREKRESVLFIT